VKGEGGRPTDKDDDKPKPKKTSAPAPAASAPAAGPLAQGTDRCANACRAFASLERAAAAICRLTKDTDARCKRAQEIVKQNGARVAVCQCDESERKE
jgi:hypothetical protein